MSIYFVKNLIPACYWQLNLFSTTQVGLTVGSKSRSQGCTLGQYADIEPKIPCGPDNWNGRQVQYWSWQSKYFVTKSHRAHLRKPTHSNPPLPLVFTLPYDGRTVQRSSLRTYRR